MSSLRVEHRGHEIQFDTATELWKCGSLALADASLHKLQLAIDRESKRRRTVKVDVLYLKEHWRNGTYEIKKATIVLLREGDRKADIKVAGERGQVQVGLGCLYPLDQKAKLDAYIAAKVKEQKATEHSSECEEKIEAITATAVREAVARAADDNA